MRVIIYWGSKGEFLFFVDNGKIIFFYTVLWAHYNEPIGLLSYRKKEKKRDKVSEKE